MNFVIIGGASSIGLPICIALLDKGHRVVASYHSEEGELASLRRVHPNMATARLDVRDVPQAQSFMRNAIQELQSIDGILYAPGKLLDAPFLKLPLDAWNDSLAVNLTGAFVCIQAIGEHLCVQGHGRVLLIGSLAGTVGNPGQCAYAAAKSGLNALARVLAAELGPFGISVNVAALGPLETGMTRSVSEEVVARFRRRTPLRRVGRIDDCVPFLVSMLEGLAPFITGQVINIDGGMSIC